MSNLNENQRAVLKNIKSLLDELILNLKKANASGLRVSFNIETTTMTYSISAALEIDTSKELDS